MREAGEHHMLQRIQLLLDRRANARIGMAKQVGPPRADGIEITLAIEVFQPHAVAATNRDHRHGLIAIAVVRRMVTHLRTRVPDVLQVAIAEIGLRIVHGVAGYGQGMARVWIVCAIVPKKSLRRVDATMSMAGMCAIKHA